MKTLQEMMDLSGRKALVLGGAGHIGFAIAQALTELGAAVAIADLDGTRTAERASELGEAAFGMGIDLSGSAETRIACREAIDRLGGLEVLVHAAGYRSSDPGWSAPWPNQSDEAWEASLEVNLSSAYVAVHEARDALAAGVGGSVVLVASIYGLVGPDYGLYEGTEMGNPIAYGAAKGGLLQLTRYLATTLAPAVRVNALSPGGVLRGQDEKFLTRYRAKTPLRRLATEEDLKGAAAFLASDLSAYVTGQNLVVDGGWTAW